MIDLAYSEPPLPQSNWEKIFDSDKNVASHLEKISHKVAHINHKFEYNPTVKELSLKYLELLQNECFFPHSQIIQTINTTSPYIFSSTGFQLKNDINNIQQVLHTTSICLQNKISVCLDFSKIQAEQINKSSETKQGPVKFMELFEKLTKQQQTSNFLSFYLNLDHLQIHDFLDYINTASKNIKFIIGIPNSFILALSKKESFYLKDQPLSLNHPTADPFKLLQKIISLISQKHPISFIFADQLAFFKKQNNLSNQLVLNNNLKLIYPGELTASATLNLLNLYQQNKDLKLITQKQAEHIVTFLDNLFEINLYPNKEIEKLSLKNRRIHIATAQLGKLLNTLNPENAFHKNKTLINMVATNLKTELIKASHNLGKKRGFCAHTFFSDVTIHTRNTDIFVQTNDSATMNALENINYLISHHTPTPDYTTLYQTHKQWQSHNTNLASFEHPDLSVLSFNEFVKLLLTAYDKKIICFESCSYQ